MKKINVIIDTSGSMAEDGKNAVVKYLINCIMNLKENPDFSDYSFDYYQWGYDSGKINNIESYKFSYSGKIDDKLTPLLENMNKDERLLLISDGNLEKKQKELLKKMECRKYSVFIGADANKSLLRDISTNKKVYSGVDILQVIKDI